MGSSGGFENFGDYSLTKFLTSLWAVVYIEEIRDALEATAH